ncbi:5' nucleotidase, NT5C type [Pseudolysinimonas sp.]|uniref:5' nucleotidase, NT5C type n=1 Tax=Pseudolysinimonas sp. TaxID=2680009 RepID=UPI003F7DA5CC
MSAQLRILVDQDEVIAAFLPGLERLVEEQNPRIPKDWTPIVGTTRWDLLADRPRSQQQAISRAMSTSGLFASLEPIPGALEALREMAAEGHDVHIVTSPMSSNPTCASDKLAWVTRYLGNDWRHKVVITDDKTIVRGDILFDDKGSIPRRRQASWTQVLIEQPHNVNERLGLLSIPSLANWRVALQFLPHLTLIGDPQ